MQKPNKLSLTLLGVSAIGTCAWVLFGFHSNNASLVLAGVQKFDYVGEFFDSVVKNSMVFAYGLWKRK